jgi:hypothetical protein
LQHASDNTPALLCRVLMLLLQVPLLSWHDATEYVYPECLQPEQTRP